MYLSNSLLGDRKFQYIQMEPHSKMSVSTQHFLFKLKDFMQQIDISFDDFLHKFQMVNQGQITKQRFYKLITILKIQNQNSFNPQKAFIELSRNEMAINIVNLKNLLNFIVNQMHERKTSKQKALEAEMNKKFISIGLFKLKQFMKNHENPQTFLKEFDRDGKNGLSKNQFNSLLVATKIRDLSNKEIRKIIIEEIFKPYKPKNQITISQIEEIFKMSNRVPIYKPISPNKHTPKPFFQSLQNDKRIEQMQNEISNCELSYPKAMRYYMQGNPQPTYHQNMQQLEDLLNQNNKFIDTNNPAIMEGIYVPAAEIFKTQKYYIFQMASSVLVRQVSRIGIARELEPKDIIQGSIGDCYFLSSIASIISIYPKLIATRFLFNKNPVNYYAVKLFIDGQWKVIKTDDQFPCRNGLPLYAKPHTKQIWVMLLQKCWAKNFGSYRAIESGSLKEGFMALTGAPSERINQEKDKHEDEQIRQLQQAHSHNYVAAVSSSNYLQSLGKAGQQQFGLVSGHAYSLLKTVKANNQTLVKLRNPWGKTIWKGLWSFSSSVWTKELRNKFNYNQDPKDGSFYISWKDFQIYFGQIVICKLNPDFVHTSTHVKTDRKKSGYLQMKVKTPGKYIVSIYQQSKRKFLSNNNNYQYSSARIIILKREGKLLKYIGAKTNFSSQVCSLDIEMLQAGDYIISAKVQWKIWENHEMVVTSYGTDYVNFSPVNRAIAPQFKRELIKSYSSQFAGTGKIKTYQNHGFNAKCETNFNIDTGIGFVRITNNSQKSFQQIHYMNLKGIKVIKPDKLPLVFKMTGKSDKTYGFFIKARGYEYSSTQRITYFQ